MQAKPPDCPAQPGIPALSGKPNFERESLLCRSRLRPWFESRLRFPPFGAAPGAFGKLCSGSQFFDIKNTDDIHSIHPTTTAARVLDRKGTRWSRGLPNLGGKSA